MANPRPLKLRAQVGPAPALAISTHLPVARVWVDTGAFHLDTPFDYWVPQSFDQSAQLGVRVHVPFGNSSREGIILERLPSAPNVAGLKSITQILSPHPVATQESLNLVAAVAKRWAGSPFDVLRSAIPPRVASAEKDLYGTSEVNFSWNFTITAPKELRSSQVRAFWSLPPYIRQEVALSELALSRSQLGQVLVILPDEKSLQRMMDSLLEIVPVSYLARLDGHNSRSERYRDFLRMTKGFARIGLGLRGSIFTPLSEGATIIISEENSSHLFEPRSPGWNVRDVAVMRSGQSAMNLIFVGYSPSLDLSRLIDRGWLSLILSNRAMKVKATPQQRGELLSSQAFSVVRKALKTGSVLFLVPSKGYGNAVLCAQCKNVAVCHCGGRLMQSGASLPPKCVVCADEFPDWRCHECQGSRIYIASRGIDRFTEEIGRSFSGHAVVNSSGDHIIQIVPEAASLVVATMGAQPPVEGGYSAVIVTEGLRFFGHSDLRSTERVRDQIFSACSLVSTHGEIFLMIDDTHPIVNALTRWNPATMIRRELAEREEIQLPPYRRFIAIELENKEIMAVHDGLIQAQKDERISANARLSTPREIAKGRSQMTISIPLEDGESCVSFLHELQRRRGISRKDLMIMRVDPYSLF